MLPAFGFSCNNHCLNKPASKKWTSSWVVYFFSLISSFNLYISVRSCANDKSLRWRDLPDLELLWPIIIMVLRSCIACHDRCDSDAERRSLPIKIQSYWARDDGQTKDWSCIIVQVERWCRRGDRPRAHPLPPCWWDLPPPRTAATASQLQPASLMHHWLIIDEWEHVRFSTSIWKDSMAQHKHAKACHRAAYSRPDSTKFYSLHTPTHNRGSPNPRRRARGEQQGRRQWKHWARRG